MVDHTDGVESLTTERTFVKRSKGKDLDGIPISAHAIVQKDKFNKLFQVPHHAVNSNSIRAQGSFICLLFCLLQPYGVVTLKASIACNDVSLTASNVSPCL